MQRRNYSANNCGTVNICSQFDEEALLFGVDSSVGRLWSFPDDLPGFSLDQAVHLFQLRNNRLHLLREPAEAGVVVVAAAGL
ncbi:uncharacterized protein METZ01_LOCUS479023, partial [marine metagenome]